MSRSTAKGTSFEKLWLCFERLSKIYDRKTIYKVMLRVVSESDARLRDQLIILKKFMIHGSTEAFEEIVRDILKRRKTSNERYVKKLVALYPEKRDKMRYLDYVSGWDREYLRSRIESATYKVEYLKVGSNNQIQPFLMPYDHAKRYISGTPLEGYISKLYIYERDGSKYVFVEHSARASDLETVDVGTFKKFEEIILGKKSKTAFYYVFKTDEKDDPVDINEDDHKLLQSQ